MLSYKDVTGSTPAQLAVEKGHRYLGMHLAEYKQKQEGNGWFGKNSKLAWLTGTQLCPVIWLLGLGLMASYTYKVVSGYCMAMATTCSCVLYAFTTTASKCIASDAHALTQCSSACAGSGMLLRHHSAWHAACQILSRSIDLLLCPNPT